MKKMKRFPFWRALLILGLLAGTVMPLQAATVYDVSDVIFSQTVTADQFVRVTEDLTVSWRVPTGTDPILNYYIKINTSSTPLTGTALDDTTYDFKTEAAELFKIIPTSTFAAYDSNQIRYLHIRTQYLDSGTGNVAYSDDVVSAAIRIDNVAPTGTLTLDPASGSTNQITVSMTPSESIRYYWLNDSSTFPGGAGTLYSAFPSGTVGLRDGTAFGNVTISAWFEDFAGNRSTAASASAIYQFTAPVSIQYNASSVAVNSTLVFTVDGVTPYNWVITPSVPGVAYVQGTTLPTLNNSASLTVEGKAVGTFTVTATPTAGGSALPATGTITVLQSFTRGDVNDDGSIDAGDAILVLRYSVSLITLTDTQKAAGNVTSKTSNNDIDSGDAIKILRYSVGLITEL